MQLSKVLIFFRDVICLLARVFIFSIDRATQEFPYKIFEINCRSSFWDIRHWIVRRDVYWRGMTSHFYPEYIYLPVVYIQKFKYIVSLYFSMGHTFDGRNIEIWVYAFYMLNVPHVTNNVKWHPIITEFATLIENMSRTRLHDCHIFWTILWEIVTSV